MSIEEIVKTLGGTKKIAKFLHIQTATVRMWSHNGNIPKKHRAQLLVLAGKAGAKVTQDDLDNSGWTLEAVND